jgi:hypothetical protein
MANPRKGIVYTLTDPRDGAIRYVGKTVKNPDERLAQHLGAPTNPAMRIWLTSLGAQGLLPRMDAVATVTVDKLDAEEARQIQRYAKQGNRLFNSPYYQANLADLRRSGDDVGHWKVPERSALEASIDALRHKLYDRVAAGRVNNELGAIDAASVTLLLAPVLAAGALMLLFVKTRIGRRVALIAGWAWYARHIGFGGAAHALVLDHLPIAQAAAFWHEYLAHPMGTLGLHLSVGAVLFAWASYPSIVDAAMAKSPSQLEVEAGTVLSSLVADLSRPGSGR